LWSRITILSGFKDGGPTLDVLAKKRYLKPVSLQTETAQQRTKVKYLFISRFFANTMLAEGRSNNKANATIIK
jgi:hypothetical protein